MLANDQILIKSRCGSKGRRTVAGHIRKSYTKVFAQNSERAEKKFIAYLPMCVEDFISIGDRIQCQGEWGEVVSIEVCRGGKDTEHLEVVCR